MDDNKYLAKPPSYHDLYITTRDIPRTSLFDLPYGYSVHCSRTTGWELWKRTPGTMTQNVIAGEYQHRGLRLDVNGAVVCDSLTKETSNAPLPSDS